MGEKNNSFSALTPVMQSLFGLFTSIWFIRFISFHNIMCMPVFRHLNRIVSNITNVKYSEIPVRFMRIFVLRCNLHVRESCTFDYVTEQHQVLMLFSDVTLFL